MSNFLIGIPTLNRADLLIPSLEKYVNDFPNTEIIVVDNGNQEIPELSSGIKVWKQSENLGVSKSWNKICEYAFGKYDNVVLLNDDVYLGYGEDVINDAIKENKSGLVQSEFSWSMFILNKKLYEYIGGFDEEFYPAYFEDSDYLYRMKLLGIRQDVNDKLNPSVVRIGSSRDFDAELVDAGLMKNREKYMVKWGGLPLMEIFKKPYNIL